MLGITKDIQSLTTFRRPSGDFVQDTEGYQCLLDVATLVDSEEGIRRGLDDVAHGRTRPAREVFDEIRHKYGIHR